MRKPNSLSDAAGGMPFNRVWRSVQRPTRPQIEANRFAGIPGRSGSLIRAPSISQSTKAMIGRAKNVNDADRLSLDPVIRQIVGGRAVDHQAASRSQMRRFETETLA